MRGGYSRTYFKIFITGWLHGSIRWQLDAEERGTWADLLALAGQCRQDGVIADNDGKPYPREYIAGQLFISRDLLDRTIAKCQAEGRIVDQDGVLTIVNWKVYQSEYDRQKPYRQRGQERKTEADYKKGPYGAMVASTKEDMDRIKGGK